MLEFSYYIFTWIKTYAVWSCWNRSGGRRRIRNRV